MTGTSVRSRVWSVIRRDWYVLLFVFGVFILCIISQRPGHDWGDDFALYLNQSRALVEGNIGDVISSTRYALQESSGQAFSPLSYPWGAPLLFAPVIVVWGIHFTMLKALVAMFFAGFLVMLHAVVARRAGRVGGFVVIALIGLSVSFVGWTDTVLAEFPFLFFLVLTLWWLDRCGDQRLWERGGVLPLVALGVLIGFTLNIRREGLALLPAVAVAQAVYLRQRRRRELSSPPPWRRLGIPFASAAGFVAAFHILLPTVLLQRYDGAGLHNLVPNAVWFRDILAHHIGLMRAGTTTVELFGSHTAGLFVFLLFGVAVVLGIMVRLINHGRHDGPLVAYLVAATLIVGVQPFHEGRYMFSITPLLVYFAYQGVATTITDSLLPNASRRARAIPAVAAVVLIGTLTVSNVIHLVDRTAVRLEYRNEVTWGPEHPTAQEMFDAVRTHTRRDDVVVFFRSRAMIFYSERQAIQLNRLDHILSRADWYAMEKGSTYFQVLLTAEEAADAGLTAVWENDNFVLWKVPDD